MKRITQIALIALGIALAAHTPSWAQSSQKQEITQRDYENKDVEMADEWRANGKIYVVVATMGALLTGLFAYLIWLDRRVGKLEDSIKQN